MSAPVFESRFPVGSSARITRSSTTSARAIATRCCSPPDSWLGRCPARSASPTSARSASDRSAARPAPHRSVRAPTSTFFERGERRDQVELLEDEPERAQPELGECRRQRRQVAALEEHWPTLGRSSAPSSWSSVVLPEPLGPSSATNSPAAIVGRRRRERARRSSPCVKSFEALRTRRAARAHRPSQRVGGHGGAPRGWRRRRRRGGRRRPRAEAEEEHVGASGAGARSGR